MPLHVVKIFARNLWTPSIYRYLGNKVVHIHRALPYCVSWVTYTFWVTKSSEPIRVWFEMGSKMRTSEFEFGGSEMVGFGLEGSELTRGLNWCGLNREGYELGGSESGGVWIGVVWIGRGLNWGRLNREGSELGWSESVRVWNWEGSELGGSKLGGTELGGRVLSGLRCPGVWIDL